MKDKLQQELLEKVKLGIKPSDLKKKTKNLDEGYESDNETIRPKSPVKSPAKSKVKQLQAQVKFEANKAQNYLTELQSTLAELDQKDLEIREIKEKLKNKPIILLDEFERENSETVSEVAEQALIEANQKIRELT